MSGYVHCACRDCMDVAVSGDDGRPALCGECEEAGCTSHDGRIVGPGVECQREDAYAEDVVWVESRAERLKKGDVFLFADERDNPKVAHVVSTPVTEHLDSWVKFCTHVRRSDRAEGPSVVEGNTVVYVLR